jgi:hypothetical protein
MKRPLRDGVNFFARDSDNPLKCQPVSMPITFIISGHQWAPVGTGLRSRDIKLPDPVMVTTRLCNPVPKIEAAQESQREFS